MNSDPSSYSDSSSNSNSSPDSSSSSDSDELEDLLAIDEIDGQDNGGNIRAKRIERLNDIVASVAANKK